MSIPKQNAVRAVRTHLYVGDRTIRIDVFRGRWWQTVMNLTPRVRNSVVYYQNDRFNRTFDTLTAAKAFAKEQEV